jgi:hypothetical protein
MKDDNAVTTFLNVDVDLKSRVSLNELRDYLVKQSVFMLAEEEFFISFEEAAAGISTPEAVATLEDAVRAIVALVEAMPSRERAIWDQCESRCFDIGIEAKNKPHAAYFTLSGEAVGLLSRVRGEVKITIYAPSPETHA